MSKRCKIIVNSIIVFVLLLIVGIIVKFVFFSGSFTPLLKLNGDKQMVIDVHQEFEDPFVKACYHLKDISDEVEVLGQVDCEKIGTYQLVYRLKEHDKEVVREVKVVDRTAPKLMLKGASHVRVFLGGKYQESGYAASDDVDGDLSDEVRVESHVNMNKKGIYKIHYYVKDHSGNGSKRTRSVEVCEDPTSLKLHYNYDTYDNTMEEWWFHKSEKHERNKGAKSAAYLKKFDTYYQGPDEKVIYLTFDEGGNEVTYSKEIAEILKKHDVQATYFFTLNYLRDEADFVKELVANGNLIGNHTWHHYDMTTLANAHSVDKFVKEITETEKMYMEITGEEMPKIFRFPRGGGSERTMKMVQDLGYRNYYWSHAFYDYGDDVSKEEALRTMMEHYHNGAIYLLHPSNRGNYEAIESFIVAMKDLGYRFETLDAIGKDSQEP